MVGIICFSWLRSLVSAECASATTLVLHKWVLIFLSRTCSAPARQSGGKDRPQGMYACTTVAAVNIYVCSSLCIGKQDITETQLQSCLLSQHVLRYKYFYSFFGIFINCILGSVGNLYCNVWQQLYVMRMVREKQDAQVLACLNNPSRFYCHA